MSDNNGFEHGKPPFWARALAWLVILAILYVVVLFLIALTKGVL